MAPPIGPVAIRLLKITRTTALVAASVAAFNMVFVPVKRWRLRKIPGPRYKPVIGDGLAILRGDYTAYLENLCAKYSSSPVVKFWVATGGFVIVRDARLGKEMMNSYDIRRETQAVAWARDYERKPWDSTVLFLNGDKWARNRRALEESVAHASALAALTPSIRAYINNLSQALEGLSGSSVPVNVLAVCLSMAEDVIAHAVWDTDVQCTGAISKQADPGFLLLNAAAARSVGSQATHGALMRPEDIENCWWDKYPLGSPEFGQRFVSSAMGIGNMAWTRMPLGQMLFSAFPSLVPVWRLMARVLPDKNTRLQRKMMRGVQQGCLKLIEQWKAERASTAVNKDSNPAHHREMGVMAYALSKSTETGVDENEIMGTAISAVFGGYETVGNTLSMCLYYLSRHPEVQKKAQQEVDQVLAGTGQAPDAKDLKDMPYVSAVLNEVLRLASPATAGYRYTYTKEYVHPDGSFRIPKGVTVVFPLCAYHRDPSIWPRAHEFLPERFMQPGNEDLAPTEAEMFFPFGAGARRCPGYKLALLEIRLALATLVHRFEFSPAVGYPEPEMRTSMVRTADKVVLRVTKRARAAPEQ